MIVVIVLFVLAAVVGGILWFVRREDLGVEQSVREESYVNSSVVSLPKKLESPPKPSVSEPLLVEQPTDKGDELDFIRQIGRIPDLKWKKPTFSSLPNEKVMKKRSYRKKSKKI